MKAWLGGCSIWILEKGCEAELQMAKNGEVKAQSSAAKMWL